MFEGANYPTVFLPSLNLGSSNVYMRNALLT